jgi:alginate O-acetyltransferase complex protein AlgI
MVFSSIEFLFFFLPIFLIFQLVLFPYNITFVIFSLVFYFIGEGWFTALVIISILMNFLFGLIIAKHEGCHRKFWLAIAVSANLGLLIFFKYTGFISTTLLTLDQNSLLRTIHLPLGISFFTFHAMSYIIDVYRKDAKPESSLVNLALYILMFPQLIAGPILRYSCRGNFGVLRRQSDVHWVNGSAPAEEFVSFFDVTLTEVSTAQVQKHSDWRVAI